MAQRVAVLGTGKMGEALLSGMLRSGTAPADVVVTARRPERAATLRERYGVEVLGNAEAAGRADTLILTVKPQDMAALQNAKGVEATKLFLTQMIRHHQGAITMAQHEIEMGQYPAAISMCRSIVSSQQQEITEMQDILRSL